MENLRRIEAKDKEFEAILNEEDKIQPIPEGHYVLTPEPREKIKTALNKAIGIMGLSSDDIYLEATYQDERGILMRRYQVSNEALADTPYDEMIITYRAHAVINEIEYPASIYVTTSGEDVTKLFNLAHKTGPRDEDWVFEINS